MNYPLVTTIIPTYNHSKYLRKAILSVLNQSYDNIEIIVMDDGSTDNTEAVVAEFTDVIYIFQENQGLSAARNNAIPHSRGEYFIFLDADDWLYPNAVSIQLNYFARFPELAFVSGGHIKILIDKNMISKNYGDDVFEDNFRMLLRYNYIAHPAAVMFRSQIFEYFKFNLDLKSCQDYDLYLSIAKTHKILHHTEFVSAYRMHSSNMSSNYVVMLNEILAVMEKHKAFINTDDEIKAYKEGREMVIQYYTKSLYWDKLRKYKLKATDAESALLRKYNPKLYIKYIGNYLLNR